MEEQKLSDGMKLMTSFNEALVTLYNHVGFVEDWVIYAIEDHTEMFWTVNKEKTRVRFAEAIEQLSSEDGNYYENEIYTQRFYKKHVYRGADLTMIFVDTHTQMETGFLPSSTIQKKLRKLL